MREGGRERREGGRGWEGEEEGKGGDENERERGHPGRPFGVRDMLADVWSW